MTMAKYVAIFLVGYIVSQTLLRIIQLLIQIRKQNDNN